VTKYYELYNIRRGNLENQKFVDPMLLSTIFSAIIGSNLDLSIYISQQIKINKEV